MYWPINRFAKVRFIMVFLVEGVTYISQPTDKFARVEFIQMF